MKRRHIVRSIERHFERSERRISFERISSVALDSLSSPRGARKKITGTVNVPVIEKDRECVCYERLFLSDACDAYRKRDHTSETEPDSFSETPQYVRP